MNVENTQTVLRDLKRCSNIIDRAWSIAPDMDSNKLTFNGVILGGAHSPLWGSCVPFTLYIDREKPLEPPMAVFHYKLQHPLIQPAYGLFCFPSSSGIGSERIPMDKYLDLLVSLFLLEIPVEDPINTDAYTAFREEPVLFWSRLRSQVYALR